MSREQISPAFAVPGPISALRAQALFAVAVAQHQASEATRRAREAEEAAVEAIEAESAAKQEYKEAYAKLHSVTAAENLLSIAAAPDSSTAQVAADAPAAPAPIAESAQPSDAGMPRPKPVHRDLDCFHEPIAKRGRFISLSLERMRADLSRT